MSVLVVHLCIRCHRCSVTGSHETRCHRQRGHIYHTRLPACCMCVPRVCSSIRCVHWCSPSRWDSTDVRMFSRCGRGVPGPTRSHTCTHVHHLGTLSHMQFTSCCPTVWWISLFKFQRTLRAISSHVSSPKLVSDLLVVFY